MVLSQRRRRGGAQPEEAPLAPIQFRLDARVEEVTTEEGRRLTGRGFVICDARSGAPLGEDDFFFRIGGGMVCNLVGANLHLETLQSSAFRPGRALALVRTGPPAPGGSRPDHTPVIEVRDAAGNVTVGELPPEAADAVTFSGPDTYAQALCLWEWRTESGQRFALRLLLAPGWTTEEQPAEQPA